MGIERQEITFGHMSRKHVKSFFVWMHEEKHLAAKTCNLRLTALSLD
jgi:integrase/recombinase XerD